MNCVKKFLAVVLLIMLLPCLGRTATIMLDASAMAQGDLHKALIDAKAGDQIILPEGEFKISKPLSLFKKRMSLKGQGKDKTILNFSSLREGAQAILIRSQGITLSDLTIKNSPGDGVVARGVTNVKLINLKVEWEKGRDAGGYGLYPVQSSHVEVSGCEVSGAKEAGIYLGQSNSAVIKNNYSHGNVIGVDIENSSYVDVIGNRIINNAVGITVVGRPHLIVINPKKIDLKNNEIKSNNHINFAEKESLAAAMGAGIGIKIISTKEVLIESNNFEGNNNSNVYLADFHKLERPFSGDIFFDPEVGRVQIGFEQFLRSQVDIKQSKNNGIQGKKEIDVLFHGELEQSLNAANIFCIKSTKSAIKNNESFSLYGFPNTFKPADLICELSSN